MQRNFWKMLLILFFTSLFLILVGLYIYGQNYIDDTQLTYCGSILGGAMTLIGVWWTINNQNTTRKKELSIQFRPILFLTNNNFHYSDSYDDLQFILKLKNAGRGEAINVNIDIDTIKELNEELDINIKKNINLLVNDSEINYIVTIKFKFEFYYDHQEQYKYLDFTTVREIQVETYNIPLNFPLKHLEIPFRISYYDINQNKYETSIVAVFNRRISLLKLRDNPKYIFPWKCSFNSIEYKQIKKYI